jgi:ABC-type oligopeptide transport system substrate-binding subunit/class 3 adenylate cyclase/tetratricopeptide (TPR) repeat protein
MQCPTCNAENRVGAKFCRKCGAALTLVCTKCAAELAPDSMFCDECGTQVSAAAQEAEPSGADAVSERLQRLVPREYAERLLATRGQVTKERRIVTILFSDVKGSTAMAEKLDPEDWAEIMDGAFDVLIEPIYHYEGTLARLMGDAVLAFFGAPIAHEDDPERAIRAALDIIEGAKQYAAKLEQERGIGGFSVRVGINTGLVVVGEIGSDLRVEYTAMGDAINLAARMEQSAPPGGILITHDTYRHVRGVFDVLRQEPLRVKGKREPVQTYLVQQAKPRAFRKPMRGVEGIETRMIGRQAQLEVLQEAFYTAIEDRELQMATIVGDAGVGKSRLLHEFDIWTELLPQQFFFFRGRALQEMQGLPYSLIRNLFAFRFQIEDSDPLPAVREKLEQGVYGAMGEGEDDPMRAHFMGHLLGFELGPSPHLEAVLDDPKQLRDRALTYLADYFKALAAQDPVLILLEDLHWADDSSLDVLNHLALALTDQPVMIVSAARPALFERRPHWGEGQPFHSQLLLRPLTKRNTRRLLEEILQRVDQVPETLSDLVVAGAEGNPFFVEELVKMLIEDGVIVKAEEQWRVEPSRLTEVRLPPTLRGVLQARLDRLPLEERTVLQQAAVVGRLFWDRAVVSISESAAEGVEEAEVLNSLSALRGREMVFQRETTSIADAQEYIFKHAVLREVTYKTLLKRLRRIYHGLVADWLMEQGGERAGEYTGLIADHLELAGRTVEATNYLLEAGDKARGLYAHQEAIHAYQRALALLKEQGQHERAGRTLMKLGLTHHTSFDFQQARQAYEEGFALWQRAGQTELASPPPPAPHALRQTSSPVLTLDPNMCNDVGSYGVIMGLFSGLVELSPDNDVLPDVARRWEVSEGGRKYLFHLRDDVRWSDGTPVTAVDFEYAWKRVLHPGTGSPAASLLYDIRAAEAFHEGKLSEPDEVGVQAIDPVTLAVELEGPTGYFLSLLSHPATYPVPRHVVEAHGSEWIEPGKIVTNGPFRLQDWLTGQPMLLVRNPEYHGQFRGNVRRVELHVAPEWSAMVEMYEAGRIDTLRLWRLPPPEADRAWERHPGEYSLHPALVVFYVAFDGSRPPFDDPRVRRALVLATDRETVADEVRGEWVFPATGGFVPPGIPGHSAGIALPYDPERARQLLTQAGYPGGRGFPDVEAVRRRRGDAVLGEYLPTQWQENLGIDITWETVDFAVVAERLSTNPPHMWWMGWDPDYPDPDTFLRVGLSTVRARWRNAVYERLVEEARRSTDQVERMRLYQQADRLLVEEAPVMPVSYNPSPLLVKPWVKNYSGGWKNVIIEPH